MSFKHFIVWFIVYGACLSPALAAWGTMNGKEDRLWEKSFLIVARVADVRALDRKADPDDATHLLLLEPLLTIAGTFDPSRQSQLQVRLWARDYADSVHEPPPRGSTILIFIFPGMIAGDESRPFLCVATDKCLFMPDEAALVVLHGLGDKRILDTLAKVREARGAGGATTHPVGGASR